MKGKSVLILLLIVTSFKCYSQNSNQLSVYYGFADSELLRNEELTGSASYDNNNSYEFGFKYLRTLSNKLSIETGINFFNTEVIITPAFTGTPVNPRQEELKLVSIPIFASYSLGNYFLINGGPIIDFQSGEGSFDSQSGIGYGIGIKGKYNFDRFVIYVNPNFKRHSVIPFEKENYHQKLTQIGIKIGVGYEF